MRQMCDSKEREEIEKLDRGKLQIGKLYSLKTSLQKWNNWQLDKILKHNKHFVLSKVTLNGKRHMDAGLKRFPSIAIGVNLNKSFRT